MALAQQQVLPPGSQPQQLHLQGMSFGAGPQIQPQLPPGSQALASITQSLPLGAQALPPGSAAFPMVSLPPGTQAMEQQPQTSQPPAQQYYTHYVHQVRELSV